MAVQGKKINELTAIGTVSNETVLPAVYVSGTTVNSTANKISIEQISTKVQDDMSTALAGKQDTLVSGTNIKTINNESLLGSGNIEIQASTVQDIETISATSGNITLETNKVYKATLDGNTTFTLPATIDNTKFNQIYIQLDVTGTPTIDLGTTNYFTIEPVLDSGGNWINYEYNANEQAWYVGKIGGQSGGGGADTSLSNLTDAGKEVASSMSFPGDSRISLTVPQPKELITATSDGYMSAGTSAASMQLFVFPPTATSTDDDAMTNTVFASSIQAARGSVCIRKGQKFAYTTSDNSPLSWLRFCPSKGSEQQ